MVKPVIYVTRKIPDAVIAPYRDSFDFRMWTDEERPVPRDILEKELEHVDGLLCLITEKVDRTLFERANRLKIVANMAVGYDNIDVDAAREHGIMVTNSPGVLTETTADLTFALLMATARRLVEADAYIKKGDWGYWSPYLLAGTDVHGKTIGIVGMGRIGEAVARRAKGFGMSILYHNRSRKYDAEEELGVEYRDFDDLLDEADFVVSVVPLTNETSEMFNKDAFQKMKATAVFVNVSRGGTVDEQALYGALDRGEIRAAGLDVYQDEPIMKDHPLVQLENVVCLPHIGSASINTRTAMLTLCLDNLQAVFNGGEPITPV